MVFGGSIADRRGQAPCGFSCYLQGSISPGLINYSNTAAGRSSLSRPCQLPKCAPSPAQPHPHRTLHGPTFYNAPTILIAAHHAFDPSERCRDVRHRSTRVRSTYSGHRPPPIRFQTRRLRTAPGRQRPLVRIQSGAPFPSALGTSALRDLGSDHRSSEDDVASQDANLAIPDFNPIDEQVDISPPNLAVSTATSNAISCISPRMRRT